MLFNYIYIGGCSVLNLIKYTSRINLNSIKGILKLN